MPDDQHDEYETLMVEIDTEVTRSSTGGYRATCRGVAHFNGGKVTFIGSSYEGSIQLAVQGAGDDVQAMLATWQEECE